MEPQNQELLNHLATDFFSNNYDYLWLKTMLNKARTGTAPNATLITGSSHALNGIQESQWEDAINCSMHSQDIYYDFLCAKEALRDGRKFSKCFIVMGYYIAFQDLSRSKISRETMISRVYYPIFQDARHWKDCQPIDLWADVGTVPTPIREMCEQAASQKLLEWGTYYSPIRPRGSYFNLNGRKWSDLKEEERYSLGKVRAESHNKAFQYQNSFLENKEIFRDFMRFLSLNQVLPVVVTTPFTQAYNQFVLKEMKEAVLELVDSVPETVHFIDFNESDLFNASDFMDTDHLNEKGAEKVSAVLTEMFGT